MSSISLVFRKDKINSKGAAPIHFRLIKDRKVSYISSSITIPAEMWDDSKNRVKTKHPNSARLNSFLSNKFTELQDKFFEFETNNKGFTNKTLKENVQGKKSANFFEFCNTVLAQFEADKKIGTYYKNKSIVEKLKTYINN